MNAIELLHLKYTTHKIRHNLPDLTFKEYLFAVHSFMQEIPYQVTCDNTQSPAYEHVPV